VCPAGRAHARALRASVRRHRSRLILACFGRPDEWHLENRKLLS
jgi:hypothetical protein